MCTQNKRKNPDLNLSARHLLFDALKRVAAKQRHVAKALDGRKAGIVAERLRGGGDALRLVAKLGLG